MYTARKLRLGELIKKQGALVWRANGSEFAVVDQDDKIHSTTNRHNHTTFLIFDRKYIAQQSADWHNEN